MYIETEETITALKAEVERLRKALEDVVYACRTKLSMKDAARRALWPDYFTKQE